MQKDLKTYAGEVLIKPLEIILTIFVILDAFGVLRFIKAMFTPDPNAPKKTPEELAKDKVEFDKRVQESMEQETLHFYNKC